jgi:hypothetical protein
MKLYVYIYVFIDNSRSFLASFGKRDKYFQTQNSEPGSKKRKRKIPIIGATLSCLPHPRESHEPYLYQNYPTMAALSW